ncbi:MAG: hypothetical protein ABR518_05940, partial [Actinomycetota bacterium]
MRRVATSVVLGLTLVGSLFTVPGFGTPVHRSPDFFTRPFDHYDARASAPGIGPSSRQIRAVMALVREHPDVHLDWNPSFGTVKTVLRYGDALTSATSASPV